MLRSGIVHSLEDTIFFFFYSQVWDGPSCTVPETSVWAGDIISLAYLYFLLSPVLYWRHAEGAQGSFSNPSDDDINRIIAMGPCPVRASSFRVLKRRSVI